MSANFNPFTKVSGHFFIKWLIPLLGATGKEPVYLSLVVRIGGKSGQAKVFFYFLVFNEHFFPINFFPSGYALQQ